MRRSTSRCLEARAPVASPLYNELMKDTAELAYIIRTKVSPRSTFADKEDISSELASGDIERLKQQCPDCGESTIVCCYGDLSGSDAHHYYDNYCHVCLNVPCRYGAHSRFPSVKCSPRTGASI